MYCMTPIGEEFGKLVAGFLQAWPHTHFPFAKSALYPFTVINFSHEFNCMLHPVNPSSKSSNSGVDFKYLLSSLLFYIIGGSCYSNKVRKRDKRIRTES